jgi:hemerythrin superfamily protein
MTAAKKSTSRSAATPSKSASRGTDAIALLKADHAQVKQYFKDYEKLVKAEASGDEKQALAEQICTMLTVHATIEEEIFYPAAREVLDDEALVDEADIEHASAKELIAQIQGMDPSQDHYDARVKVLGEYIDHHVKEEQDELFPKVKKAGLDAKAVGEQLSARKDELMSTMVEPMDA